MRRLLFLAALGMSSPALAGPGYVPIQGYLTDSGGTAIDGQVDVTFTLYSDASGGTSVWTDTYTLDVVGGGFAVELGSGSIPLDLDTFKNFPSVHLQIRVAGDSAMPLVALAHVPYAAFAENAGNAATLDGATASEIRADIPAVSDIQQIARDVAFDAESELIAVLNDNYTYTAGTGVDITGNVVSADQSQIETWAVGVCLDNGTEVISALDGLTLSTNTTVDWSSLEGVPSGLSDGDNDTTYTAGTGLSLNATVFSADQSTITGWAQAAAYDTEGELTADLDDNYLQLADVGVVYTRWGRTSCGSDATLLYNGYMGGGHYTHTGGTSSFVCLHSSPQYLETTSSSNQDAALMYKVEFETSLGNLPLLDNTGIHDDDARCAVCEAPRLQELMIPGRTSCPAGWTEEYQGFLMADRYSHARNSETLCVDERPEGGAGLGNENGGLLYPMENRSVPGYDVGSELACVVCTK